jgi:alanyl-tRNA synthetase
MQSHEIRNKFLVFFQKRGHIILPSAPLVPLNDPSVLFNTAGMQPLVPYLMGEKHPEGTRLASCQKCVRTGDLDDIGDNRHFSFFEMLGNWSLGDYFKDEAIKWSYEFLTSNEEGLGLDPTRLRVTIFEGDENAPYDQESKEIWMNLGIPEDRIYALPADDNWWSPGENGPCGPCSEMFYDMDGLFVGQTLSKEQFIDECKKETIIEIWNDVFMEYEKKDGKVIGKLKQKNVDTGAGLERLTAVMQGKKTAYDTDIFDNIFNYIKDKSGVYYSEQSARIICDHLRTSMFMVVDGVTPSNKDRGYILRRLLRRALIRSRYLNLNKEHIVAILGLIMPVYRFVYEEITRITFTTVILDEFDKFSKTLEHGLKEFEKGIDPFTLATTYGFPIELTEELAHEKGITIDRAKFDEEMKAHQEKSRSSSAGMFKGGLANTNEKTVQLHTAHHLLLKALQEIVSADIHQKGSNITEERLRIDFNFDRKLTDEEKQKVEDRVNEQIKKALSVEKIEMKREDAEKIGAEMEFGIKYPDMVSVYVIKNNDGTYYSKEFCGGPHVTNTQELGIFKIQKEEAVAQGVRRIKAVLL